MMKLRWWHLVIGILAGVAAGRWSSPAANGDSGGNGGKTTGNFRDSKHTERPAAEPLDHAGRLRQEIRRASPAALAGLTYQALETPDNQLRQQLVLEALSHVDESNWKEVMEQFAKITRETGRTHDHLWKEALTVLGKNAGPAVMEEWRRTGLAKTEVVSWSGIYGWAMKDPQAAGAWLDDVGSSEPDQRQRLLPALVAGMALTNSTKAMELLASLPAEERANCVGHFTWNLVQNEGIDRAVDWMVEVKRAAAGSDNDPYARQVMNEVMGKLFATAGERGGADEIAARLERIHAAVPLDEAVLAQHMGKVQGATGLALLDQLAQGKIFQGGISSSSLLPVTVSRAVSSAPEQCVQWFGQNAASPVHDAAALTACQVLASQGNHAAAEAILATVRDEQVRASITRAIAR